MFSRILKLERWAVLALFNFEVSQIGNKQNSRHLLTFMLTEMWRANQLAWIWLHRIAAVAGSNWNLDLDETLQDLALKFKGMKFFEKVHEITQTLLDSINEV